ncbi:MAG: sigma-54 dependent transcriptional regulator [Alphaproteobacteria bacterium]
MAHDVLIVDDEADIRDLVAGLLEDEGFGARVAGNSDEALAAVKARTPSLIILDIWLKGSKLDGLEILSELRKTHPDVPVVIISGHGTIETAVAAIKKGAYDFVEKPFQADRLVLVVSRAIEAARLRKEHAELMETSGRVSTIVGKSAAISQLRQTVGKVGPTNSRVMITGPAGAGKEVAARAIHVESTRKDGPFVVINAASMAPERVEQELFGVEGGNGRPSKTGVFEQAHRGTLYLDEVVDMPKETQGKVLRSLVEQKFSRVGGDKAVQVDVRVISSSSRDLRVAIDEGRFREDLYHRLNVVPVHVPGLAERRDDIPQLVAHFMESLARGAGLPKRRLGDDAMALLQAHEWPGNVRQLRNIVERLMILSNDDVGDVITADHLPINSMQSGNVQKAFREDLLTLPLRDAREEFERDYLQAQIERFGGNISRTAGFVGMERSALHRKLKMLGLGSDRSKAGDDASDAAETPETSDVAEAPETSKTPATDQPQAAIGE